jgi:YVTN family beta-propeller protein
MRRTVHRFVRLVFGAAVAVALATIVSAFNVVIVPVGINPAGLAIIPQSGEIVVANSGSNDVSIVDPVTNHVSTVHAGSLPGIIAVNRATGYAYVANVWENTVTAIYGYGEGKKRKTFATGVGPVNVAVNAMTNKTYVVNNEDGTVSVIDENTDTTATVPVGRRPSGIGINEVTNRIYVGNIWDSSVTVIDGSTDTPMATVPVGDWTYDVAVNPVTNKIYVANAGGTTVTVIDGATHNTVDIPAGSQPNHLAVNTVTNKIYVVSFYGDLTVIDGDSGRSTQIPIPAGQWSPYLATVAINEVTNKVYVVDMMSKGLLVVEGLTNEVTVRALEYFPTFVAINTASNTVYVAHSYDGRISIIRE